MGVYMNGRPIAAEALEGLARHPVLVEEAFTILHEGKTLPSDETSASLRTALKRYEEHEREFGKAGHAAFGLWELWADQGHPLGELMEGGVELLGGDVVVLGFDAEQTAKLAHEFERVGDDELKRLFFSPQLREFADYTDVEPDSEYADEEVEMFLEDVDGPRSVLRFCREHGLGLIVWVG